MPTGVPVAPYHERFMKRVEVRPDGCWIWTGATCAGYGVCNPVGNVREIKGREYTHRYMYKHVKGDLPDGTEILHSCDVRLCCNPEHLSADTRARNVLDMLERNPKSCGRKIRNEDVLPICELAKTMKICDIARQYGVGRHTIGDIVNGKTYKYIPRN